MPSKVVRRGRSLCIEIKDVINGREGDDGELIEFNTVNRRGIEISNFRGLILEVYLYIYLAFTKPGFGSFFVPYLLFYTAVLLGIYYSLLPRLIDFLC
ncbi:hypothetical protein MNBD_ALPHA01-2465 [hydrothermal vent metagenome]|uniref:Uncharacterized protein n=1 Tax=hydrothermal vent metagenome TaxID=652676 RepID=A0A3B0SLY2_9ZZZZ